MQRIVASQSCGTRQDASVDRARRLTEAVRLVAGAFSRDGEFIDWSVVPRAEREDLESALGELRAALADADVTLPELMGV
jgi:hypothetical protein